MKRGIVSQLLSANKANSNLLTCSYVIDEENFFMSAGSRLVLVLIRCSLFLHKIPLGGQRRLPWFPP